MTFQASDIGTNYDIGIATRPNLDGSTAVYTCANENGSPVPLSQVAFMFLADDEVEEAVDLIRKDQMIRLSSPNLIDREFTLYPQATQGNWVGGETQRIFTDPTSYYQGRGLIWPTNSFVPVLPTNNGDAGALKDDLGNVFTSVANVSSHAVSGISGGARGVAHTFQGTSSAGTFFYIAFTATDTLSTSTGTGVARTPGNQTVRGITIIGGTIYFLTTTADVWSTTYAGTTALTAPVSWATLAAVSGSNPQITSSLVGKDFLIAVYSSAQTVRVYLSAAGTFVDVVIPANQVVRSMAINGSTLYMACSDGADGYLLAYDVTAQQTSTPVQFKNLRGFKIGVVQGVLFIAAYNRVGLIDNNSYLTIECYLYSGNLQFIGRLNPVVAGLPPNLSYLSPVSISTIATYAQYAFFAVGLLTNPLTAVVIAYDVVRGTFFTAVDQFNLSHYGGSTPNVDRNIGLAATAGADANQQPNAPVLGKVAMGTTLPAGSYTIQITWTGAGGTESLPSDPVSKTLLAGDALLISLPIVYPLGAGAPNVYLTAAPGGVNLGLLPAPGSTLTSPTAPNPAFTPPSTSTYGTAGDFTLFASEVDTNTQSSLFKTLHWESFGTTLGAIPVLAGGGRIISSVIDFTSATVKFYRQIVATHEPIPVGGSFSLYAYLDLDGDNLSPDTTLKITNSTAGATVTVLQINRLAKKLIYIVDWPTTFGSGISAHPISVAVQAATGWVFNVPLALSDSAMTNGQNPNQTCFQNQDKQLDALAARNFIRQILRQRGGQCVVTYSDGDSYNAVIADYHVLSKKFKTMNQPGDRKVRYEGRMMLKIQEDL